MAHETSNVSSQPQNETTRLRYIEWNELFKTEKPYEIISHVSAGAPACNFSLDFGPEETVHDIRGQESDFNLDTHGFQVRTHIPPPDSFEKDMIEKVYLPSLEKLLKDMFGTGTEVCLFDWRVNSQDS